MHRMLRLGFEALYRRTGIGLDWIGLEYEITSVGRLFFGV